MQEYRFVSTSWVFARAQIVCQTGTGYWANNHDNRKRKKKVGRAKDGGINLKRWRCCFPVSFRYPDIDTFYLSQSIQIPFFDNLENEDRPNVLSFEKDFPVLTLNCLNPSFSMMLFSFLFMTLNCISFAGIYKKKRIMFRAIG